jgi:putative transposase
MGKRHTPEEIGRLLAEVETRTAAGAAVESACRALGIGSATYYLWQKKFGRMSFDQLEAFRRIERENAQLRRQVADLSGDIAVLQEVVGKVLSPLQRRGAVRHVQETLAVSERRACAILSQPRCTQRYRSPRRAADDSLTESMRRLSQVNPRAGYRRIAALMRAEGASVSDKQVYRLWRRLRSLPEDKEIE